MNPSVCAASIYSSGTQCVCASGLECLRELKSESDCRARAPRSRPSSWARIRLLAHCSGESHQINNIHQLAWPPFIWSRFDKLRVRARVCRKTDCFSIASLVAAGRRLAPENISQPRSAPPRRGRRQRRAIALSDIPKGGFRSEEARARARTLAAPATMAGVKLGRVI